MKLDFDKIKTEAVKQLENDWESLQKLFERKTDKKEVYDRIVKALLKLREFTESQKFTLGSILYGKNGSCLNDFSSIINSGEWMRLPGALEYILWALEYNIEDDGFLRLMRLEILDDIDSTVDFEHEKSYNYREIQYFLSTEEDEEYQEIAKNWFKAESTVGFINPVLVSAKLNWFGNLEKFADFLELLADKKNWDDSEFTGTAKVDQLMEFDKEEELLEEPFKIKGII